MSSKKEIIRKLKKNAGIKTTPETMTGHFIFDTDLLVNMVIFSCHKFQDKYGFGFLLPKTCPIFTGKGEKAKIVGREQLRKPAVITSEGLLFEPTTETENIYKIKYVAIPTDLELRIDLKCLASFLEHQAPTPKGMDIFNAIKGTYEKFLYFHNPVWYDVHALWDIGTYFFQLFYSYPLLELQGLAGTAKSKIMNVSRLFTLNPTPIMVNPSEASMFRVTHTNRPTKYLDECEKLFVYVNGTWQTSPLVELINGSYNQGSSVPRLEKVGNSYKLVNYGCYSPTMLGSIAGLRDATATRAISHICTKAPDSDKRGEIEVEEFANDQEYQETRNSLYLFAWQNWQMIEEAYKALKLEKIKKRDFQLWRPLLAIAKVLDAGLYERVLEFAEKLSLQRKQDFLSEGTLDYKILKIVNDMLEAGATKIYMKDISSEFNSKESDDRNRVAEKTISTHLDKIGFRDYRNRDRIASFIEIDKNIFDTIITPICPLFSPQSTQSPYYKGKEEEKSGEEVVNSGECKDTKKSGEYGDCGANGDGVDMDTKLHISYEKIPSPTEKKVKTE